MLIKRKAFAYVTHGVRLLVFTQPGAPEAGVQVPAGTVEAREAPEAAALREAAEETGLGELRLAAFLGRREFSMAPFGRDELHERFFFHLECSAAPPEQWLQREPDPSGGADAPIWFAFRWAGLPAGVPPLIAGHDALLPELLALLGLSGGPAS
ncbi:MAG TPA: NUDIX domain-containing protein [Herpetosiphonaceae bacterium]